MHVYAGNDRLSDVDVTTGDLGRTSNDMSTLLRELHLIRTPLAMSCLHVVTIRYTVLQNHLAKCLHLDHRRMAPTALLMSTH